MIKWTYINSLWKEYEFEIENWIITHSNMWDEYDNFIKEIYPKQEVKQSPAVLCKSQYRNYLWNWKWYWYS